MVGGAQEPDRLQGTSRGEDAELEGLDYYRA
jgi:hypothetical protein